MERSVGNLLGNLNQFYSRKTPILNPFMPSGLFYLIYLDASIPNRRGDWIILLLLCFIESPVFNANSVDPDQTPRSAASDLGLHCLPVSLLGDARYKWVV